MANEMRSAVIMFLWSLLIVAATASVWDVRQSGVQAQRSSEINWGFSYWYFPPLFGPPPVVALSPDMHRVVTTEELARVPDNAKALCVGGFETFGVLAEKIDRLKRLESFELLGAMHVPGDVMVALSRCASLRSLRFGSPPQNLADQDVLDALARMASLESIEFSVPVGRLPDVLAALAFCKKLRVLKAAETGGPDKPLSAISKVAGIAKLTALREVELHAMNMDGPGMEELCSLPQLASAAFQLAHFNNAAAAGLGRLCAKVENLSLSGALFSRGAAMDTTTTEGSYRPIVKKLDMTRLSYGADGNTNPEMIASIAKLTSLEELSIGCLLEFNERRLTKPAREQASDLMPLQSLVGLKALRVSGHHVDKHLFEAYAGSMPLLESLSLDSCDLDGLTPEAVSKLHVLASLRRVELIGMPVIAAHVAMVASIPSCQEVSFAFCSTFDDAATTLLAMKPAIASVNVAGTRVTATGLATLAKLPKLTRLNLTGCTSCRPDSWPSTPKLEVLWLDGSGVGDKGMPTSAKAPALRALSIGRAGVGLTAESLKNIGKIRSLTYLNVVGVPSGASGAAALAGLAKLEWLVADESMVSSSGNAVAKPFGASGLAKLRRCDIVMRCKINRADQVPQKLTLRKSIEKQLRERFPKAEVLIHAQWDYGFDD